MNKRLKIRINVSDILSESENFIAIKMRRDWTIFRSPGQKGLIEVLKSFLKLRDSLKSNPVISSFLPLKDIKEGVVVFSKTKAGQKLSEKIKKENLFSIDLEDGVSKSVCFMIDNAKEEIVYEKQVNSSSTKEKLYYIFNKPYNVLCQFTKQSNEEVCLGDFDIPKDIYPVGRLDKDSEGLLLLTNDGDLSSKLTSPKFNKEKVYLIQVEGVPTNEQLEELRSGVLIKGGYKTRPCKVEHLIDFSMPKRNPPIRERKNIPTSWLKVTIVEGRNRQVRRMSAAVGLPTLRLIRVAINDIILPNDLISGKGMIIEKVKA